MSRFLLLWCAYAPDNYQGHRVQNLKAENLEDAKKEAKAFLESLWVKGTWEFRIIELAGHDSGSWTWRTQPDLKHNEYTTKTYWEA